MPTLGQRSREAYCRGTGLGGKSACSQNTWNWRLLQVERTQILGSERKNSVNILLFHLYFLVCYYIWAINFSFCLHIYLYPHILQANCYFHTLAKWLSCRVLKCCVWQGCRIRHVSLCVEQRDVQFAWVSHGPSKENERLYFFLPLITFYNMSSVVWRYFHGLEKRNSRRNGKDLANGSSASHSCNPRLLLGNKIAHGLEGQGSWLLHWPYIPKLRRHPRVGIGLRTRFSK